MSIEVVDSVLEFVSVPETTGLEATKSRRQSKPPQIFMPELYASIPRIKRQGDGMNRTRNESAGLACLSKWDHYRSAMKKAASALSRELHFEEVYLAQVENSRGSDFLPSVANPEVEKCRQRIQECKRTIVGIFRSLEAENKDHKRWNELSGDGNEEGLVNIDNVYCSVCGTEDVEGNDILFCDKRGCNRAYHQSCLDPPLTNITNLSTEDWFCWQCECTDDLIANVNYVLDKDIANWREFFPEVDENTCSFSLYIPKKRGRKSLQPKIELDADGTPIEVPPHMTLEEVKRYRKPTGESDIGRKIAYNFGNLEIVVGTIVSYDPNGEATQTVLPSLVHAIAESASAPLDESIEIINPPTGYLPHDHFQETPGAWTVKFDNGVTINVNFVQFVDGLRLMHEKEKSTPKKRGRKPNDPNKPRGYKEVIVDASESEGEGGSGDSDYDEQNGVRRKRRTPSKSSSLPPIDSTPPYTGEKRKRGRPRKHPLPVAMDSLGADGEHEHAAAAIEITSGLVVGMNDSMTDEHNDISV